MFEEEVAHAHIFVGKTLAGVDPNLQRVEEGLVDREQRGKSGEDEPQFRLGQYPPLPQRLQVKLLCTK